MMGKPVLISKPFSRIGRPSVKGTILQNGTLFIRSSVKFRLCYRDVLQGGTDAEEWAKDPQWVRLRDLALTYRMETMMTDHSLSPQPINTLSPEQFLSLDPSQRPPLVDVRTNLEYLSGHAPASINLSLDRIWLGTIPVLRRWIWPQWLKERPKDQPIAVICLSAHRSPIAARALAQCGFTQIFNISGGMLHWQQLNLPIHKGWQS